MARSNADGQEIMDYEDDAADIRAVKAEIAREAAATSRRPRIQLVVPGAGALSSQALVERQNTPDPAAVEREGEPQPYEPAPYRGPNRYRGYSYRGSYRRNQEATNSSGPVIMCNVPVTPMLINSLTNRPHQARHFHARRQNNYQPYGRNRARGNGNANGNAPRYGEIIPAQRETAQERINRLRTRQIEQAGFDIAGMNIPFHLATEPTGLYQTWTEMAQRNFVRWISRNPNWLTPKKWSEMNIPDPKFWPVYNNNRWGYNTYPNGEETFVPSELLP